MAQVNYKGYARSVGFDPIKAGYGAIDRMQEHDSRVIRGMENQRDAERRNRDQYAQGLDRKFSLEQDNRNSNYRLKQSYRENRQRSLDVNAQRERQNASIEMENQQALLKGISNLSETASKKILEMQEAKADADMMDEYVKAMSEGLPMERQQKQDMGESLLKTAGERQEQIADSFAERGAPPEVVMQIRTGNKARDYGRLKAYSEMAAMQFGPYLSERLMDEGISDPGEIAKHSQLILHDFLKENGLFGLKADFLAPALLKMRQNINAELQGARESALDARSEGMRNQALDNLSTLKTGEALNQALLDVSRSYKGGKPIGIAGAKQLLFEELADTTRYSDDEVLTLLGTKTLDQDKSWGDRFPRDVDDLMRKRREDSRAERGLNESEQAYQAKEAEKQLIQWFETDWNGDEGTLQEAIAQARMNGIPTDRLQAYQWRTTTEKNSRFWEGEFNRMWEEGTLSADDVNQPGVPFKLRQEYLQRVKTLDDQRSEAGMGEADLKKTFENALRPLIKATSTDSSPHFSLGLATNYATSLYNRSFKRYAANMDPGQAAQQAMNDVLNQIQKGGGAFTVIEGTNTRDGNAFFAQFTPGGHSGAPRFSTPLDSSIAVNKFAKNPGIIQKEVFVDRALLKDISDRVEKGRPISIPRIFYDMARVKPDMNAVDILNEQLGAAGFPAQVGGGAQQQSQINDPRLQELLKMPTQANINSAIIGSGHAPATVRAGANGFQDIMSITAIAGHRFPMLAAAQWALESGYGQYQSGKHNYFGIKGGGNTVSTQEFVNGQMVTVNASFRNYNSPLESAKDYVSLTQNSRYAPGLAAARTPREAAMAIKAAGYATDPNYVEKLVGIMKGQGINVDAPYDYQGPATRNPAYMTPTVAYKIYGIGPTSTGPHLDVKDVTGNRFQQNALDGFVSVQMNGRRVPLSQVPISDDWDEHKARGSHGIDYMAPNGTPVLLSGGARIVSRASTEHGDKLVIQLPDGRRFSFLHGKAV